ncbi:alpha/beta fold hydrolase [Rhodococcus sp. IEGM 1330]|uniref:alpha/beta fold hydrolase n=1 Tax=Rhodococcus sp. IEGM 1330 TaxID=3082225 RepID=UPI0029538C6E|nr:alpha/beta fold hydrolase [Rhodococcus sp. IEGM 1330]MDV8022745.1 alpha/beta fold hydrolase [Rhodococcus sp. IEGM 1330]
MLLIHGIGHRRQMWDPVVARLNGDFDTVSVDLPGFGNSPPLPKGDTPTPHRLADHLEKILDELGWPTAHLVGNSLGAWVSLELARRGRASSVCALMPAGLWRSTGGVGHQRRKALFAMWTNGTRLPMAGLLIRNAALRTPVLFGLFGRPWRIPAADAVGDAENLRTCDFARTMSALDGTRFEGGAETAVPVTVLFGGRDPLIRVRETDLGLLPDSTRVLFERHLGHVPTWDDPDLVSRIVRESTL